MLRKEVPLINAEGVKELENSHYTTSNHRCKQDPTNECLNRWDKTVKKKKATDTALEYFPKIFCHYCGNLNLHPESLMHFCLGGGTYCPRTLHEGRNYSFLMNRVWKMGIRLILQQRNPLNLTLTE